MSTSSEPGSTPVLPEGRPHRPVHVPVLLREVLQTLDLRPGLTVVDGTVGAGGHSRAILERIGPAGRLIGLDRDARMLQIAATRLSGPNVHLVQASYAHLPRVLHDLQLEAVDRLLLDLGWCSDQLADASRGFSFQSDGPLDLRYDPSAGVPAWKLINTLDEDQLAELIFTLGEDHLAKQHARRIVSARANKPLRTTWELTAALTGSAVPWRSTGPHSRHPATQVFQALRIAVNQELEQLEAVLNGVSDTCLKPLGILAVISFHSLEDRMVKQSFRDQTRWDPLLSKPVSASPAEQRAQPPLADSPAARREKEPGRSPAVERPSLERNSLDRPSLERPAPRPIAAPVPPASAPPPAADWNLAAPEATGAWTRTLAVCAVLGLAGAGCFLLWKNYSPLLTGKDPAADIAQTDTESQEPAADEPGSDEELLAALAAGDEEEVEVRPVAQRKIREVAATDEDFPVEDDLFEDELADRPARSPSPVRRAAATAERLAAAPHRSSETSHRPRSDFDELADGGEFENTEPADDPDTDSATETVETELVEVDTPPRRSAGGSHSPTARATESFASDEFDAEPETTPSTSRLTSAPSRLRSVDADEEVPSLRISDSRNRVALDGPDVELAVPRTQSQSAAVPAAFDEPQLVEDLESDSVNGLEAVDMSNRRALSRTRVLRPTEVPDEMIAENESLDETPTRTPQALPRDPERTPITPRRSQSVAQAERLAPRAGQQEPAARPLHPATESYVVEANDTYWSISKKVYGTPRFFQALAEHNRAQVAEPERLRPGVKISTPPEQDLLAQYARYVPGTAGSEKSGHHVAGDLAGSEKLGVASESPTRRLPGRESKSVAGTGERGAPSGGFHYSRSGEPLYLVGEGDTLSTIAQQHLGKSSRSDELYQLNQDRLADPDRLRVGTVLRLPADASRIGLVPRSDRIR